MTYIGIQTIDMSRRYRCNLAARMLVKLAILEVSTETLQICVVEEIDERITDIGLVMHIHRQVEEVVSASKALVVDLLEQSTLHVPVWDVPKHRCRFLGIAIISRSLSLEVDSLRH